MIIHGVVADSLVAPSGGAAWTPADLPDLTAWWDAQDAATVTHASGSVSAWADKSGNGHTLSGINAPQYTTSSIGGLPTIDTNGSNAYLRRLGSTVLGVSDNTTAFLACRVTGGAGTNRQLIGEASQVSSSPAIQFITVKTTGTLEAFFRGSGQSVATDTTHSVVVGDDIIIGAIRSPTTWLLRFNGESDTSGADSLSGGGTGAVTDSFALGCYYRVGVILLPCAAKYGEVIVVNDSLAIADAEKIEGYLAHKWGMDGSLPISHPYKSAPPDA